MAIFLSHTSALEAWRSPAAGEILSAGPVARPPFDEARVRGIAPGAGGQARHVLVFSQSARYDPSGTRSHICTRSLPDGGIFRVPPTREFASLFGRACLDEGLFVCSPELCAVQMAGSLDHTRLLLLLYEFLGLYRVLPSFREEEGSQGFASRERPLMTNDSLGSLAAEMPRARGIALLGSANSRALSRSASPMETRLAIRLTLPSKMGGFGLRAPMLNHRIEASEVARNVDGRQFYSCDFFWPGPDLDLEYDSDGFHSSADALARDSRRRNALASMGIKCLSITREQYRDPDAMDAMATLIAKSLGRRPPTFSAGLRARRCELALELDAHKPLRVARYASSRRGAEAEG